MEHILGVAFDFYENMLYLLNHNFPFCYLPDFSAQISQSQ